MALLPRDFYRTCSVSCRGMRTTTTITDDEEKNTRKLSVGEHHNKTQTTTETKAVQEGVVCAVSVTWFSKYSFNYRVYTLKYT